MFYMRLGTVFLYIARILTDILSCIFEFHLVNTWIFQNKTTANELKLTFPGPIVAILMCLVTTLENAMKKRNTQTQRQVSKVKTLIS